MAYLSIKVEFHTFQQFDDIAFPIDTFRSFIEALGNSVKGSNFNKYYDPQRGDIHPRIAVRINVDDETEAREAILKIARNLKERGVIRHYEEQLKPWTEPPFVVKAHELGTACAIELRDKLLKNSKMLEVFRKNRGNFLSEFVYVLLGRLGFQPFITWNIKGRFPLPESALTEVADSCAQIYHRQSQDFESPDFLNQFIHAFFNCVGLEAESIFYDSIIISQVYKSVFDSRNK